MKRTIVLGLLALVTSVIPSLVHAVNEDGKVTVDGVFQPYGNTVRQFSVALTTRNATLISSAPADATLISDTNTTLGVTAWRFRQIINVSTCASVALYSTNQYNVFSTTYGIILSSDSSGMGAGDVYEVPGQDQVWGIWTNATGNGSCAAGQGAVAIESYYSPNRRR